MQRYSETGERKIKTFYATLNEREKRHFVSLNAELLGHGGIKYMMELCGVSKMTIHRGKKEFAHLTEEDIHLGRIRKEGGGKKAYHEKRPNIDEAFLEVLKDNTAGDPMDDTVKWTQLKQQEISELLSAHTGVKTSRKVVAQLLKKHGYVHRKAQKSLPMKEVEQRDEQFCKIAEYKQSYEKANHPIISVDTKKKEYIGNFYREGQLYCTETIYTFDHDFNSFAESVVIPYGIYDYTKNAGYVYLGNSKDTSEFGCDNIKKWWIKHGRQKYKGATSMLILCDGGGSNNANHYLFKEDLQKLSNEIGIRIRVAHYPPYTSKYNPIEHRLFSYISKTWAGVVFDSIQTVKQLIEKTTTKTGLKVAVEIVDKMYETGRKDKEGFKENMKIIFDEKLPKWNYQAIPQNQ